MNFAGGQRPDNYETALQMVAKHGWTYQQHTLSLPEVQFTAQTYEKVNAVTPLSDLHWSIAHVPAIDPQTLESMKAIGVGMALHGWKYLQGGQGTPAGQPAGPPLSRHHSRAGFTPARARTPATFPCSTPGMRSITW